jgi:DNA-binding NtrC family response regulator
MSHDPSFGVLIVDDDQIMRDVICETLGGEDLALYPARGLLEARRLAERQKIDLLISDLYLSDGSGLDLITLFRSRFPSVPVIVITAYPATDNIQMAEELEVHSYLANTVLGPTRSGKTQDQPAVREARR